MVKYVPTIMGCLVGIFLIVAVAFVLTTNMRQENAKALAIIERGGAVLCEDHQGNMIVNLKGAT